MPVRDKGNSVVSYIKSVQDAFILDNGVGNVFIWVGKGCTMDERKKAMIHAGVSEQWKWTWINKYCNTVNLIMACV